jgi:cyclin-dependent kinase-like
MENYESLGVIGEGTYGVVTRARHRETGLVVAIKKFKESDEDEQVRKTSLREVRVLKQLRHDNIIALLEVFRRKGKLYLVFEYVEKTILEVLESRPSGLDAEDVRRYTYQLLRGVEYCHAHNVMHRDIKPENILISRNGTLKLCDFGFARTMSIGGKYTDYVATRWYRSPELLVGDVEYTKGVDVWAIGCIFAEVSNGMPLFPGESDVDQLAHIMRCFGRLTTRQAQTFRRNPLYVGVELPQPRELETLDVRFPVVPRPWLQFLKACLKNDPEQRESCTSLMNLPYFTDGNFREEFEQDLKLIFEKEHRQLQGIGNRGAASSSNKPPQPASPTRPAGSQLPPTPTPHTQQPENPLPNPGRTDSPAVMAPPPIGKTAAKPLNVASTHPANAVPSIGSLWSQYLASTTATPGHSGDQLPDLGQRVQTLQTQHPIFAAYPHGNATTNAHHTTASTSHAGLYYRTEAPATVGHGAASHGGGDVLAQPPKDAGRQQGGGSHYPTVPVPSYISQPASNPSLAMTSTGLQNRGYQPPASSHQSTRPMFPSLSTSNPGAVNGAGSSNVANASLGLSYKKKNVPAKKNVLSSLNLAGGAYGSQPAQPLPAASGYGGNPYSFSGTNMMLQGHHTGTSQQPPQSQLGHRRTSKPWMQ